MNPASTETLIDRLLADQSELHTAINDVADKIDSGELRTDTYKHLIPLDKPQKGEQYAFQVELDKCTSCKSCVAACHSLNGLEEKEAWRDVGLLLGGEEEPAWQQTVTTACHHCLEPQCMHGCPVNAYEKDADTGIVRHLDDQCIGCQYCSLKCPYDVPKYSSRLGIVRKCDMCYQRLEVGEAPACVQACPNEAIKIIKVDTAPLRPELEEKRGFLKGAPLPDLTLPTTQYVGRKVPETARPADQEKLVPAPSHLPLVLMLTLTQAGVGVICAAAGTWNAATAFIGAALFFSGLTCSILHLGRPLGAWRFFLGLKTSWLSREILAFSLFAPLVLVLTGILFFTHNLGKPPEENSFYFTWAETLAPLRAPVGLSAVVIGLIAVFTSVMIYHDTGRKNWHLKWTLPAFFGTTGAFLGATLGGYFSLVCLIPVIIDALMLLPLKQKNAPWSPALHRARLMWKATKPIFLLRVTLGILAALISPVSLSLGLACLLGGELFSRLLYFRCVHSPKMPGNF